MSPAHVVAVAGDRPAHELGVVDAHEHLFLRSPALAGNRLEVPVRADEEVRAGTASGTRTVAVRSRGPGLRAAAAGRVEGRS